MRGKGDKESSHSSERGNESRIQPGLYRREGYTMTLEEEMMLGYSHSSTGGKDTTRTLKEERRQGYSHGSEGEKGGKDTALVL